MSHWPLFVVPTLIWGSTFYAITFQLGSVPAAVSVIYRFTLACALMFTWCLVRSLRLDFALREHAWFLAQGACSFGFGYVLVYLAEERVTSGLVAMVFALMVFLNPALARLAFGTVVTRRLAAGALLGVLGTGLLFWRDAVSASPSLAGLAMTLGSMVLSVIGNVVAERNHRAAVPTASGIAWGMLYGTLCIAGVAVFAGLPWRFEATVRYVGSLAYLAVVGSVIAFGVYFRLIERVGAGPASYVSVVCPLIAMLLSTALEGYRWTLEGLLGVVLVVTGMVAAIGVPSPVAPARGPLPGDGRAGS